MPRTAGVSSSSETELTRRRPRPRTGARCDSRVPIRPMTSWTLTVFLAAVVIVFTLSKNVFNRLAALGSDVASSAHFRQAVKRGANPVVRVRRAGGFRHDIGHAHYFEDCAHGAAGDHAGTRLGGHHHYFRCAVTDRKSTR